MVIKQYHWMAKLPSIIPLLAIYSIKMNKVLADWSKDVYNLMKEYIPTFTLTYWPNQTLGEAAVTIAGNNCVELKII